MSKKQIRLAILDAILASGILLFITAMFTNQLEIAAASITAVFISHR